MILKLLIDFYRWLYGMPSLEIQTVNEGIFLATGFGAIIDICAIIAIIGLAMTAYNDRKQKKRVTEYDLGYNDGRLAGYAEAVKKKHEVNNG